MSFYVCLPSNACSDQFPSNTQSNYSTILKKPIILDDDYDVAITEMIYSPKYLANFGQILFDNTCVELVIENGIETSQLAQQINKSIRSYFIKIGTREVDFDTKIQNQTIPYFTQQFQLQYKGKITFLGNISMILSGNVKTDLEGGGIIKLEDKNLSLVNYAAIYTNIIDEQYFGDSLVPILRCVNLSSSKQHTISTTFDNPVYVPVNKKALTTINIKIADLEGHIIRFKDVFSYVIITLHFKKRNNA